MVQFFKVTDDAVMPGRGSEFAAGYDLFATTDITIDYLARLFKTGVGVRIPLGYYGQIFGRSGLGVKGVISHAGVIDSDYRGEIGVVLSLATGYQDVKSGEDIVYARESNYGLKIPKGKAIAQIVFLPHYMPPLETTARGEKGFGSSDKVQ